MLPTLDEFYKMCESHDWYYEYSDDHTVWEKGNKAEKNLLSIANQNEEYKAIYDSFRKKFFN